MAWLSSSIFRGNIFSSDTVPKIHYLVPQRFRTSSENTLSVPIAPSYPNVLIEVKHSNDLASLEKDAKSALTQIQENRYFVEFNAYGSTSYLIGLSFMESTPISMMGKPFRKHSHLGH